MKKLMTVLALAVAAFATSAHAADAASAPTKQQTKMGSCSADFKATGKPGSERQAFMSECLKKDSGAKKTQQQKMKTCSAEGKGKKGDEYKAFMKECLSK
ncbi:PsiF family protein [Piscinibacter sp.]|uniref:PsiF family protein n=1 Tax=Piscinibacter sp. TaxID=1903157 RepID=UPI00355986B0